MGIRDGFVKVGILKPSETKAAQPVQEEQSVRPTLKSKNKVSSKDFTDDLDTAPKVSASGTTKEMYKMLDKAIHKASQDGFDYLKFKDTIKKMTEHVPDEAARYAAAGASAEAMKVSAEDLITSAQGYIAVLNEENKTFTAAQDEVESESAKDEEQLKAVDKQIADLQAKKDSLERDITDSKGDLSSNKAAFDEAFDQIAGEIKQDISKIKKYLKN